MMRRLPQFDLQLLLLWIALACCVFAFLGPASIVLFIVAPVVLVFVGFVHYLSRRDVERTVEATLNTFLTTQQLSVKRVESRAVARAALNAWTSYGKDLPHGERKDREQGLADYFVSLAFELSPQQAKQLAERIVEVLEID